MAELICRPVPLGAHTVTVRGDWVLDLWSWESRAVKKSTRLDNVRCCHSNPMGVLTSSRDCSLIAACEGLGCTIFLWKLPAGEFLKTFEGHAAPVTDMAFAPTNLMLASAAEDSGLMLWDVSEGKCLYSLSGHTKLITSVRFCPAADFFTSGSLDGTVRLWGIAKGELEVTLHPPKQCKVFEVEAWEIGPETVLAFDISSDGSWLVSGTNGGFLVFWDLAHESEKGHCRYVREAHVGGVRQVAFSPTSQILASCSCAVEDSDSAVKIWNMQDGSCRHSVCILGFQTLTWHADNSFVTSQHIPLWSVRLWELNQESPEGWIRERGKCFVYEADVLALLTPPDAE